MEHRGFTLFTKNILMLLTILPVVSGCSPCKKEAFLRCSPKTMGVVMGYEIKVKESASFGKIVALGALGGAIGGAIAEASQPKDTLDCEERIHGIIQEEILRQLDANGFSMRILKAEPKKWRLFENSDDTSKKVFDKLMEKYEIGSEKEGCDAIVFVEYTLQTIAPEKMPDLSSTPIESLRPDSAMARVWIYDVKTKENLYYEIVGHGYGWAKEDIPKIAKSLLVFRDIPALDKD